MKVGIDVRELERGKATGIGQYLNNFLKVCTKDRKDWEFTLFGNQVTEIYHYATKVKNNHHNIPDFYSYPDTLFTTTVQGNHRRNL